MDIIHAVCDENGRGRGGLIGDQTGKEIRRSRWYNKPFKQLIQCKDHKLGERIVIIASAIEKGNFGYNRDARWTGYISICENGIENGIGDFDCSSLALSCCRLAGLNIKEMTGSTRDIAKILCATGKFELITEEEYLNNPEKAYKGSMYCTPGQHVVICAENGTETEEEEEEEKKEKKKYVRSKGNVKVRETPVSGKHIATMHKGDILPYVGVDEETKWYIVSCGYVTSKPKYTEVVEL